MPPLDSQRAAHAFFLDRLRTLEPFTKQDVLEATGWTESALDTYWSKQFKGFLEPLAQKRFRVKERFRRYANWREFRGLVTQVKSVGVDYAEKEYPSFIQYEFYMPLAHENALRVTLDSLFYRDTVLPRLQRIGPETLGRLFVRRDGESDDALLQRVLGFIQSKFGGYSIYHVNGRFRGGRLVSLAEAADMQKAGQRYLIDETTAVTRFIFPCRADEAERVRVLFQQLFIASITELVSGEDEIWMVETGLVSSVHVWEPKER